LNPQALLDAQDKLQRLIPGFKFNLGFSGKQFHRGSNEENAGEDFLLGMGSVQTQVFICALFLQLFV